MVHVCLIKDAACEEVLASRRCSNCPNSKPQPTPAGSEQGLSDATIEKLCGKYGFALTGDKAKDQVYWLCRRVEEETRAVIASSSAARPGDGGEVRDAVTKEDALRAVAFIEDIWQMAPDTAYLTTLRNFIAQQSAALAIERAAALPAVQAAPQGAESAAWRVGEFWSSAYPGTKVLMLAVGERIAEYGAHKDFIRWVSPPQAATGQGEPAEQAGMVMLAPEHKGMKVDYRGMLAQARKSLNYARGSAQAFMLEELERNLTEMAHLFYAGDVTAVDAFLQLYCIARDARPLPKKEEERNG